LKYVTLLAGAALYHSAVIFDRDTEDACARPQVTAASVAAAVAHLLNFMMLNLQKKLTYSRSRRAPDGNDSQFDPPSNLQHTICGHRSRKQANLCLVRQ
jgi:hypothetical protein